MTRIHTTVAFVSLLIAAVAAAAVAAPPTGPSQPQISPLCSAAAPLLAPVTLPDRDRSPAPVPLVLICYCGIPECLYKEPLSPCSIGTCQVVSLCPGAPGIDVNCKCAP